MHRVAITAGAIGLLALTSLTAVAAKPSGAEIKSLGLTVLDPCAATQTGEALGQVKTHIRGKSGRGVNQYKAQVKLNDGVANTSYNVEVWLAGDGIPSCTQVEMDEAQLTTDGEGEGVKNVKFKTAAGGDVVFVLRDEAPTTDILGTETITLATKDKKKP